MIMTVKWVCHIDFRSTLEIDYITKLAIKSVVPVRVNACVPGVADIPPGSDPPPGTVSQSENECPLSPMASTTMFESFGIENP